jgi:hypothetical protein
MRRAILITCLALGCGRGAPEKKGTAANPVEVCEHLGEVCKLDKARLGVCSPTKEGTGLTCAAQH